jgi:Ca2+-binding RTX toxin-like protein
MSDAVIPMTGANAWVYDPTRNMIDYTTSDGVLHGYSLQSDSLTLTMQVGGTPGSLAISPDGHYLLIGNTTPDLTSPLGAAQKTYAGDITRIDLTTQNVDHVLIPLGSDIYGTGVAHVAVASNGIALATVFTVESGTNLFQFSVATAHPSISSLPVRSVVSGGDFLFTSENGNHVFVAEGGNSSGPLDVFSVTAGGITASTDLYAIGASGFQDGGGSISEAAGRIVDVTYGNVYVFDLNLKPLADLSSYQYAGAVVDAVFSPDGKDLLLWDGVHGKVEILDAASWRQVGLITLSDTVSGMSSNGTHNMTFVDGGHTLALFEGSQMDLIDLTGRMPGPGQTLSGPGGDSLAGSNGDDTISGGSGADNYLRGGYGNDSIAGGATHNDVNGNQGDDTIVGHSTVGDWLLGGQGNDSIDASASTGANILNGNLGNDTIIGGAGADFLRGGQGDDVIHAGSGNDWISGDLGNNTIYGGQGMDTFRAGGGHDTVNGWHNGDIVQVDKGVTVISVSQVNADVHILLSNGGEVDLLNTQQTSLQPGWIVTA